MTGLHNIGKTCVTRVLNVAMVTRLVLNTKILSNSVLTPLFFFRFAANVDPRDWADNADAEKKRGIIISIPATWFY